MKFAEATRFPVIPAQAEIPMPGIQMVSFKQLSLAPVIPAQAGIPSMGSSYRPETYRHPRAGGDPKFLGFFITSVMMSSPRRRGSQMYSGGNIYRTHVIPAQAVSCWDGNLGPFCLAHHPRAGGIMQYFESVGGFFITSSPRRRDHGKEIWKYL